MTDWNSSPAVEPTASDAPRGASPAAGTAVASGEPIAVPTATPQGVLPKASRRNYAVIFTDAMGYFIGTSFFASQTILQEFATHLTSANVLIGLLTSIHWSATAVTQLAATGFTERFAIKKWILVVVAGFERLPLLGLAILTPILADTHPALMLVVLYIVIGTEYLLSGCATPAYTIVYSKVIPPRQRGTLFGLSTTLANVLKMGTGFLIPYVLTTQHSWGGFPNGFALCFVVGFVILFATYLPLAWTDEPRDELPDGRLASRDYTLAIWRILRHDRDFQLYAVFGCFSVYALSGTAFYVTYALRELGAPQGESGWFTVVIAMGTMVSLYWGRLADRSGNRAVLVLAAALAMIGPAWALFAPSRFWFYPVVLVSAVAACGLDLAGFNLPLEFSAPTHVARYVGLLAAVQFVPRLTAPLVAGALADALGFKAVFVMAGVSAAVALVLILRMRDPRGRAGTIPPA